MSLNKNLNKDQRQKNDEFYTQLSDIENELRYYTGHFRARACTAIATIPASPNSSITSRTTSSAWA